MDGSVDSCIVAAVIQAKVVCVPEKRENWSSSDLSSSWYTNRINQSSVSLHTSIINHSIISYSLTYQQSIINLSLINHQSIINPSSINHLSIINQLSNKYPSSITQHWSFEEFPIPRARLDELTSLISNLGITTTTTTTPSQFYWPAFIYTEASLEGYPNNKQKKHIY